MRGSFHISRMIYYCVAEVAEKAAPRAIGRAIAMRQNAAAFHQWHNRINPTNNP
jgi:hypothetical protein